jgi:hypothetical protein
LLSPGDITMFLVEGFELQDMQGNEELFEEFRDCAEGCGARDELLADVSVVIRCMNDKFDQQTMTTLRWVLAYSEQLQLKPIDYLIFCGYRRGTDQVLLAAEADVLSLNLDNVVSLNSRRRSTK